MTVTVALTREPPRNDELRASLEGHARVLEVPLTATRPRTHEDVVAAIAAAPVPRWIVVTSARAAAFLGDARAHAPSASVAAVGPVTAAALEAVGATDVRVPDGTGAAAVAGLVDEGPVLSLGAAVSRPELADALGARGIAVTHVPCYDTVPADLNGFASEQLTLADVLVVEAPSAWAVARAAVRRATTVVVTGETTRAAVAADHERVVLTTHDELATTIAALARDLEPEGGLEGAR